ncbi:serine/threonine-protein kinase [Natronospira proteinivora]|uniref:Serine/threonine-protein kinase n=1 Tax=Natronospira proteinivora TaxID=1807133 RepID=A0ABT1G6X1_9GAMM|nr:protein kinase [Natronospira proteinivora]MCP1727046.1 serine/threonine-protein kinase [Natronospira proteinivora]
MALNLGRYELGPEIGRGNMAVVHRAFDPRLQRQLAVKILHAEFSGEKRHRRAFLAEAHAAGRLSHPGITTIHDVGESNGKPFMAMELLEGATLQQRLDSEGPLSAREVVDIGIQLAEALDYAHRAGVVHRDVKAENVVMTGQAMGVKLTDFGIARLLQEGAEEGEAVSAVVGTPNYMAPEQIRDEAVDGRADLYALGVLLYRLLSGRLPFARGTTRATLDAILNKRAPRLRSRDEQTPDALISIVETLMSRLPVDRYQTGAELAEDLRQVQLEMDSQKRQAGWGMPISVKWPAALGLMVALILVLGATAVYYHQRAVMTQLVFDYGGSMAEVIATESAEDLLLGDAVAVQAMVEDMQRNQQMVYLRLSDHNGRVMASTEADERGELASNLFTGEILARGEGEQQVGRYRDDGAERFLFQSPVIYQDRVIGGLALGISARPLSGALRTSLVAMGALMVATILTVLLGAYVLSRRLKLPLRVLGSGLDRVAAGDYSYRIRMRRRDEFGEAFARYNLMTESLQGQQESERSQQRRDPSVAVRQRLSRGQGTQPIDSE